jgi:hypothetical protein
VRYLEKIVLSLLLVGWLAACGGPATPPAPTAAPTGAAAAPTSTAVPETPTQTPAEPTAVPPTLPPTAVPVAPVRIAVQMADNSIVLVDTSGNKSLAYKAGDPADLASIAGAGNVLSDKLYLALSGKASTIMRIGANGPQTLDWIKGPIVGLAVTANRLAWGKADVNGAKPTTSIVLSALDGSGLKTALSEPVGTVPRVLKPLRWSQDGTHVFFGKEPLGIGGYILFGGFTNLWSLDPAGGKATEVLAERAKNALVCMDDLSPNEKFVADHCNSKHIEVVDIAANKSTVIDPPVNVTPVGLVGGARFNPDSTRVAYGLARHEPDNEQGWVAVSDSLSGKSRLVAISPAKDYFWVAAWLDADTLVLQSNGQTPGIWLARADGSNTKPLAEGIFVGVLNSQSSAQACGEVRTLGPNAPRDAAALQAEDCFFQAFQQCQLATLTVTMSGVDAGTINRFAIEKQGDNCRISGSLVRYVVPRPTPMPEQFICQGLTRKNGGLLFSACGAQGDIVVPAP